MSKADILDFDSLDTTIACDKGAEIELRHFTTKAPLGVFVSIVGVESHEVRAALRKEVNRERLQGFQDRDKEVPPKTVEEQEAETIRLVARVTKGWRTVKDGKSEPVIYWKGEKLDFTPDNLNRWLANPGFGWVRLQIIEAANDLGTFMGN